MLVIQVLTCGLLGLPPSHGVIPQSPMHTKALVTLKKEVRTLHLPCLIRNFYIVCQAISEIYLPGNGASVVAACAYQACEASKEQFEAKCFYDQASQRIAR